jgi:tetratricopeptide (TPR) repeat protein
MVTTLVADGWQLHKGGKRVEALRLFDLAAELAPLDREVLGRRTYVLTDGAPGVEALRAAVAASPDALIATQQLDYALAKQQRFDEVISLWNGFLSRNPEVGRAYCERAGAFAHLGRRAESIRDLERACELGITEGCARTSR